MGTGRTTNRRVVSTFSGRGHLLLFAAPRVRTPFAGGAVLLSLVLGFSACSDSDHRGEEPPPGADVSDSAGDSSADADGVGLDQHIDAEIDLLADGGDAVLDPETDAGDSAPETLPSIVPLPVRMELRPGTFELTPDTSVFATEELLPEARWWSSILTPSTGEGPPVHTLMESSDTTNAIMLQVDSELAAEAYELDVRPNGVDIVGGSPSGVFWGLQTLRQMLPPRSFQTVSTDDRFRLIGIHVEDSPRFPYRGLLLDEGRWFFGGEFARRVIDWMVLHKLNTFHWHLTDDSGWRIEILGWPRLTEVGAYRAGSQEGDWWGESNEVDWTPHGGYYTQEEITAIVAYAAERHVTIIPEIDVPGHAMAALAAYPSLACTDGPFEVSPYFGIHEDVLCVCEEETFAFIESVFDEVMGLFPSEVIHFGGDEVPTTRWEESELCATLMTEVGLSSVSELHEWAMARIAGYLESQGRRAQGWNEIFHHGLPESAVIQFWRGDDDLVAQALAAGHDVVQSPYEPTYLNRNYETTSLADAYALRPRAGLDQSVEAGVVGLEPCMWTPWHSTEAELEFQMFPRLAAMAEVAWSPEEALDFGDFSARLVEMLARYDALGIGWGAPD